MKSVAQLLTSLLVLFSVPLSAQQYNEPGASPVQFPELIFTEIKGAPKLSMPVLIRGTDKNVSGKGMGWASPLIYDADGDGLDDLLIGEFNSGLGTTVGSGSFLQVNKNTGTREKPQYSGHATPLFNAFGTGSGSPISIFTWCCMAFTPRLADLNGDGELDLVTGQYEPGDITWFKKLPHGFGRGELIEQAGQNAKREMGMPLPGLQDDTTRFGYWSYSAAAFANLFGNGLNDMVVGGTLLRVARNTGSKEMPKFGVREPLRDVNGNLLTVLNPARLSKEKKAVYDSMQVTGTCMVPYTVDWDNDGVVDLLVTNSYNDDGKFVISFFKGVKKDKNIVFRAGVPLFVAKNEGKAFPGSHPNICVANWNNDGIKDLIIGTTVSTMDGKYDAPLSWSWELPAGTYRMNPAYMREEHKRSIFQEMRRADSIIRARGLTMDQAAAKGLSIPDEIYKRSVCDFGMEGLAHEGYVYVMLGSE